MIYRSKPDKVEAFQFLDKEKFNLSLLKIWGGHKAGSSFSFDYDEDTHTLKVGAGFVEVHVGDWIGRRTKEGKVEFLVYPPETFSKNFTVDIDPPTYMSVGTEILKQSNPDKIKVCISCYYKPETITGKLKTVEY